MALPVVLLVGSLASAGGALIYDWFKASTKAPDVVINEAEVVTQAEKTDRVLLYGGIAIGVYMLFKSGALGKWKV